LHKHPSPCKYRVALTYVFTNTRNARYTAQFVLNGPAWADPPDVSAVTFNAFDPIHGVDRTSHEGPYLMDIVRNWPLNPRGRTGTLDTPRTLTNTVYQIVLYIRVREASGVCEMFASLVVHVDPPSFLNRGAIVNVALMLRPFLFFFFFSQVRPQRSRTLIIRDMRDSVTTSRLLSISYLP
jgi:hypothetical protein